MTVSTTGKVKSTRGLFKWSSVLQNYRNATWNLCCVTCKHSVGHCSILCGKSWDIYNKTEYSLWCSLHRAAVCEGGDDDDGGKVLYLWLRVMDGKRAVVLTFLRTHIWLNSLKVWSNVFPLFLLSNIMKGRISLFRAAVHWPPVAWGKTNQPMKSWKEKEKKNKKTNFILVPMTNRGIASENHSSYYWLYYLNKI